MVLKHRIVTFRVLFQCFLCRLAVEQAPACEQIVHDRADAENIALFRVGVCIKYLGGKVARGPAYHFVSPALALVEVLCIPEIGNPDIVHFILV